MCILGSSGSLLQGISLLWWSESDVAWSWQGFFAFWNHFGSLHKSPNAHWMSWNRWHLLSISAVKKKVWTKPNSADTWTCLLETAHLSVCVAERGAHLAVDLNSNKYQFRLIKLSSLRQATRHIDKAGQNTPSASSCAANVLNRTTDCWGWEHQNTQLPQNPSDWKGVLKPLHVGNRVHLWMLFLKRKL